MARIPDLKSGMALQLPAQSWPEHTFAPFAQRTAELRELARKAGTGSVAFNEVCDRLRTLIRQGRHHQLSKQLNRRLDLRAFSWLMCHESLFRYVRLTPAVLERFTEISQPLTRLTLLQLTDLFFQRFDELADEEHLDALCMFFQEQFRLLSVAKDLKGNSDLQKINSASTELFSRSGPENVVRHAREQNQDLDSSLQMLGLATFGSGRFQDTCRYIYFLDALRHCQPGEEIPELAELGRPEVHNAVLAEGALGIEALKIMIDRSAPGQLSDSWQRTILSIAGDPRVPRSSENYQRWWSLLDDARVGRMKGWLSRFDLKLFLQVLEAFGKDTDDEKLQRMYPARKTFLEGLLAQNIVGHTRLFLSREADAYVSANYKADEVPQYARLKEATVSVIYIQLGTMHLVEGTHNTKLRIFPRLPSDAGLLSYETKQFSKAQIGTDIKRSYEREFRDGKELIEITHSQGKCSWQHKAISYLHAQGLDVEIEGVLSTSDYQVYKQLYGLSVASSDRRNRSW